MTSKYKSKLETREAAEHRELMDRAEQLPGGREDLLAEARKAIDRLNEAVMAGDAPGVADAFRTYDAVVWRLNGDTFFASRDCWNPEAGGHVVDRHCAAMPGQEPLWGQKGEFLISVQGMRARVEIKEGFGPQHVSIHFHAVDVHRPFISETGFLSAFDNVRLGKSPREAVEAIFQEKMSKRPIYLTPSAVRSCSSNPVPDWLERKLGDFACAPVEDAAGQLGLGF